eukprot:15468863-Alexandrium_andersonii.AAC.1
MPSLPGAGAMTSTACLVRRLSSMPSVGAVSTSARASGATGTRVHFAASASSAPSTSSSGALPSMRPCGPWAFPRP